MPQVLPVADIGGSREKRCIVLTPNIMGRSGVMYVEDMGLGYVGCFPCENRSVDVGDFFVAKVWQSKKTMKIECKAARKFIDISPEGLRLIPKGNDLFYLIGRPWFYGLSFFNHQQFGSVNFVGQVLISQRCHFDLISNSPGSFKVKLQLLGFPISLPNNKLCYWELIEIFGSE